MKNLFYTPTQNIFIQFFRYVFVGGIAFVADAGVLWLCSLKLHYLVSAAAGFIFGLFVNFLLSKFFIFTEKKNSISMEFLVYAVIGAIGLLFTELLMYLFTDVMGVYFMLSKVITAVLVLIWNFIARKIILYRSK